MYHQLTRTHTVLTGRKTPKLLQSPCQYTKYCLRAFHCLNAFLLRQNCSHLTALDFRVIFVFLRRRCVVTHQGEKDKKHLAYSMQSPAKRVCMEKEEGDCLVQLLPQGGSGTVQASSDAVKRVCSCQLMVLYKRFFMPPRFQNPRGILIAQYPPCDVQKTGICVKRALRFFTWLPGWRRSYPQDLRRTRPRQAAQPRPTCHSRSARGWSCHSLQTS